MKIISKIKKIWNCRSSVSFVNYLRMNHVEIGKNVLFRDPMSTFVDLTRPALISIGNNVDINRHFQILTHDWGCYVIRGKYHDFINSSGGVKIGDNVYFGTNVIILKGVTIGDNCIIGAGSIVNRSIPANSVATGNPCRVVCSLDDYYERRKQKGLAEAVEYVKAFKDRFGRVPLPHEMYEEFTYFVDKDNIHSYNSLDNIIKGQLKFAYTDWVTNHHAPFKSFNDFLKYVRKQDGK